MYKLTDTYEASQCTQKSPMLIKRPSNRRAFYYLSPHMLSMSSHISRVASESK